MLRISIITPSFNQGIYLEETISSVLGQRYPNLEYLVIDGGSTDETLTILDKYGKLLHYWTSEQDRGQSHAINKGLSHATGDILGYLNSDDLLLPGALAYVEDFFKTHRNEYWLCGGVIEFGDNGYPTSLLYSRIPSSIAAHLITPYHFWQQGIFWKREIYEKLGGFDERFHYAMDHEYWTRMLVSGYRPYFTDQPLGAMRMHQTSKSYSQKDRFDAEISRVLKKYAPHLPEKEKPELQRLRRRRIARHILKHATGTADMPSSRSVLGQLIHSFCIYPKCVFERNTWGVIRFMFTDKRTK